MVMCVCDNEVPRYRGRIPRGLTWPKPRITSYRYCTTFNLSPTPKLSLQTHPIVNRYSRLRRSPRPPRPSSTCSRSRAYFSGEQGSLTLKTADGRRESVLKECSDRFGIVSSSRFLLSCAYTSRNLGLARSPGLA
jgi:hypothetical protein